MKTWRWQSKVIVSGERKRYKKHAYRTDYYESALQRDYIFLQYDLNLKCLDQYRSVSTEIFYRGFLYLLVGKVGGTKNKMEVQEL